MDNLDTSAALPSLEDTLRNNPGWLDELVNEEEASRILDTPVPTLRTRRVRGGNGSIPFVKIGRSVKYTRRDLFEAAAANRRRSTSDSGEGATQ